MKSLVIVCCLAIALGLGAAVGCGPKNKYCPDPTTNGACVPPPMDAGQDIPDVGPGEATIFE